MRPSVIRRATPWATPGSAPSRWLLFFVGPLLLALASCSGKDAIEGQVSQWSDPPANAHSFILVDSNAYPQVIRFTELGQAAVELGEFPPRTSAGVPSFRAYGAAFSDTQGAFSLSTPKAPFRSELVIYAQHEGCEAVQQSFRHLSWFPHHSVAVVLVCRGSGRR